MRIKSSAVDAPSTSWPMSATVGREPVTRDSIWSVTVGVQPRKR